MKRIVTVLLAFLGTLGMASASDIVRDSIIVVMGDKSRIIIYGENKEELKKLLNYDVNRLLKDVGGKIDSTSQEGTTRVILGEVDGDKYRKRGRGTITIQDRQITIEANGDTTYQIKRVKRTRPWWQNDQDNFVISFGLNAYGKKEDLNYNAQDYDLRPLGSRFFSLGFYRNPTLIRGEDVALRMRLGFEFTWYNFMFEGNNVARKGAERIEFTEATEPLKKSKLTVCYVTVPVMPTIAIRKGVISHIGAGGYVGYRLDSYTKTKTQNNKKDHNHAGYWLNDFRYGLMAEIGFRNSVDLFFQYDLNELYQEARGPKVQAVSFGVRLN
ncbi:outer membrane beta-barrel protein [Siphonobacter curvatus]|uniref:Outer membrane protein beta-barrel domain-containing protein n=1 Tax=Siphonobacter curvatus TaxID=2094562 RepID=A0A2S7IFT2_9BACT|nr:outer membrane beta-barrel protein [Siphonobacter curvatus]PQA54041.1 hypothetical protein C5O19_23010 [Siphonobacter curvatus]